MIDRDRPVFLSGHRGMVGSALVRRFEAAGFTRILTATRQEVDLRDQSQVDSWFEINEPAYVVHAAGTVGGIHANRSRPAEFLYDNLMIHATVLHAAWRTGVEKLLYLGSSCIYPRDCPQPIREEYLLTGPLEKTNEAYAVAKIAGLKSCAAYRQQYGCHFISAMPTNMYGPHDNFDLQNSHVLPALIRKFHESRVPTDSRGSEPGVVTIWGSGRPRREFLYVNDFADACLFLMDHYEDEETINVGVGEDITIAELAQIIRQVVCPETSITFDASMPDGTLRKLLDTTRLNGLGWRAKTPLSEGISTTYAWLLDQLGTPDATPVRGVETT